MKRAPVADAGRLQQPLASSDQLDDLRAEPIVSNPEMANGYGQVESARAGAARIYVQHVVPGLDHGLVRMPEDHGSTSIGGGLSEEMPDLVQHQDLPAAGFDDLPFRDGRRPWLRVIVAAHAER